MSRQPKAEVEISAHSRGLSARLREARAKFANFGLELRKRTFGKDLVEKGFWGKAGAEMVGNLGARSFGMVAGALANQGRAVFAFEDRLNRLQIAAGKTPEEMRTFAKSVRDASTETGISAENILAGAQAYVALTGDMDGAIAKQREFAQIAQATGSDVMDIAGAAAALKQNLKVVDSDTIAAFSALATQGKMGAIEIKDLAGQLSNIAPLWARFSGGTGMRGLRELGSALQVAKQGFGGDAGETVTGVRAMLTALTQNAEKFRKGRVRIFDKDPATGAKSLRNVLDIVRDIGESKLAKDPTKLVKAFGSQEAYRAYVQLSQNRQLLDELIAKSSDASTIQRDLQTRLQSTAGRTQVAFEKAKNSIAEAFTPERIELFANALVKAVELGAKIVGYIERIADKVEDIIGGTEKEARGDVEQRFQAAQKMTPADKKREADALLQAASTFELRGHDGGVVGRYQDAWVQAARKRGFELRQQALVEGDPWGAGMKPREAEPDSGLSEEQKARARAQLMKLGIEGLKRDVATAIRDGFRELNAPPVTVKADGKNIADVARNSSRAGARPGG